MEQLSPGFEKFPAGMDGFGAAIFLLSGDSASACFHNAFGIVCRGLYADSVEYSISAYCAGGRDFVSFFSGGTDSGAASAGWERGIGIGVCQIKDVKWNNCPQDGAGNSKSRNTIPSPIQTLTGDGISSQICHNPIHGKSLLPLMEGEAEKVRDCALYGYFGKQMNIALLP